MPKQRVILFMHRLRVLAVIAFHMIDQTRSWNIKPVYPSVFTLNDCHHICNGRLQIMNFIMVLFNILFKSGPTKV